MANQIIIDIGAVANDGTGDPLRTAFGYVNNNFSNIWATGVANSNISFSGNKILTTNTNGNLVLAPNGIGKVQANVDIIPNANNTLSLGSLTNKWNTVYAQNLDVGGNVTFTDLTVNGNLTVVGNTIQIGNIVTDTKTIQLANTASTANAANGSGVTVGANDNIATMLYNSTSNVWTTNIGLTVTGNVTGTYFIGNGSLLTGITSYGNANVAAYLPTYNGNISAAYINVANNVNIQNDVSAKRGTFTGDPVTGDASLYIGSPSFTNLGTDVMAQFTGNVPSYAQINLQNYGNSNTSSGDYIITADNGTDSTHFLDLGLTGSNWDGTQPNSLGNRLGPNDGYLYVQDGDFVLGTINGTIETWKFDTTGNLTVPGYITQGNAKIGLNENGAGAVYLTAVTDDLTALIINTENAQLYANDYVSVNAWTFENSGNLTTSDLVLYESGDDFVVSWDNEELVLKSLTGGVDVEADNDFNIRVNYDVGATDYLTKWAFGQNNEIVNITGNSAIITEAGNLNLQGGRNTLSSGNVQITAVNNGVAVNTWTFDNTGTLTAPGNIVANWLNISNVGNIASLQADVSLQIVANASGSAPYWTFNSDGNLFVPGSINGDNNGPLLIDGNGSGTEGYISLPASNFGGEQIAIVNQFSSGNGIVLTTNGGEWHFGNSGVLTVPGNIVMPPGSSLVGTGASPAPNISGFSSATFGANVTATGNISGGNLITTGNVTAGNFIGTSSNVTLVAGSYSWTFDNTGNTQGNLSLTGSDITINNAPGGNEGAELKWALPAPANTVLSGTVVQDVFQNGMRFFESGGNTRGLYMDLGNAPNGTSTAVGYRDIPQIALGANVTANATNAGRHFYSTTAGNLQITIPDNANVAFPTGATLTVVVNAAGNVVVAQGTGVSLYMAGSSSTGNRTVGAYGLASVMKVATDTWVISGTGVY